MYTVSFYDGGVLLPDLTLTAEKGKAIILPPFASACYGFDGWQLDGAGDALTGSYTVEGDLRFDAKFSEPIIYISAPQELDDIRDDLSGKYKLTQNISLSGYSSGWTPIGSASDPFSGCLDGNGFKVTELYVDVSGSGGNVYAGLFGYIDGGEVSNIGVEADKNRGVNVNGSGENYAGIIAAYVRDGNITGSYAAGDVTATSTSGNSLAGGLVGSMVRGSITGSYAAGDVTAGGFSYSYAGGLVGRMGGYSSSITDSYAAGDVTANSTATSYAGGLVGYMGGGTITNSYAAGDVNSSSFSSYAGGLVGYMGGTITDSYAAGDVTANSTATSYAGGLVGYMGGTITDSYAAGDVTANSTATSYAGGLVGLMVNNSSITNSVAANPRIEITQGATKYMGRIAGDINGGTADNNFALDTMQAAGGSFNANHGIDKTNTQLKDPATYENAVGSGGLGWQFGNSGDPIWKMPSGGGYPILYWQSE